MATDINSLLPSSVTGTDTAKGGTANSPVSGSDSTAKRQHRSGTPAAATPKGDSVTLTRNAMTLSKLDAVVHAQSEIDSERVNNLRLAIETGSYTTSPLRVAEKFMSFEMLLMGRAI